MNPETEFTPRLMPRRPCVARMEHPTNGRLRNTADTREQGRVVEHFKYAKTHPIINVPKVSVTYELRYDLRYIRLYGIENLRIC